MEKLIRPLRLAVMALITAALIAGSVVILYKLQIVEGRAYYEESRNSIVSTVRVPAARGSILDRYGRVLVENRVCNNLRIDEKKLFGDLSDEAIAGANETLLRLASAVTAFGDSYTDTLPITREPPFEYTEMTELQRYTLDAYVKEKQKVDGLKENPSAVELMAYMRERYKIDNSYTAAETRTIAGIRYELNSRYIDGFSTSAYIFAQDVSMDLVTTLMETGVPGFEVESSFIRDYHTTYASQILGYVQPMDPADVEKYSELGYEMDAQVGRAGAELAFERYLHGTDGEARVTRTASGVTTGTVYTRETTPGDNVYLTIDIGLQEAAENALNAYITQVNAEREIKNAEIDLYGGDEEDKKQLITGAAAVAVKVDTGEPLAIASWPGYDIPTLLRDYTAVAEAENAPMFNRALQAAYAPGSTFKPCVAIAALCEGKIATTTTIDCEGVYTHYADYGYSPRCWIYSDTVPLTHGTLSLSEAITHSCNYYFYTLGDYLQITLMAKYAKLFGLGEHTGIELYEVTGQMTSDELYQANYGRDVYMGETIAAAIGQAESLFTPMQMAEYCAAIANGGVRHGASLLGAVSSYDFGEVLFRRTSEVLSEVKAAPEYYDAVHTGMRGVVTDSANGAAYLYFYDTPYSLAAKTGTAQLGEGQTNNAMFICYAPYENPEIAIAVAVEKGSAGASNAPIARQILDYYFAFKDSAVALETEGELLK